MQYSPLSEKPAINLHQLDTINCIAKQLSITTLRLPTIYTESQQFLSIPNYEEQPFLESSSNQEISELSWNQMIQHWIHNTLPLSFSLTHIKQVHTTLFYLHFNIIIPFSTI
jgi:hypothetical protein